MPSGNKKFNSILITFTNLFLELITLILAIVLTFLLPLICFVVFVTFGTFRWFIKNIAKWLRPEFGKMVTLRGETNAIDLLFKYPRAGVTVGLILEGTLNINRLKTKVTQNLLNSKFSNGELKYPELKQYLKPWMGYFFWKDDKTFDLNRHITTQNVNDLATYSDVKVKEIYQNLLQKPWNRKRPLWDISLVTNYYPQSQPNDPHTVLFFNFHHSLSDGFSILKLLTEGLGDSQLLKNAEPTYTQRNLLKSLLFFVTFPFMVGYELAQIAIQSIFPVPFTPLNDVEERFHVCVTDKISLNRIKEIKNHFQVSFASVVNAVVAGGLRDFLISKGSKVPEFLLQGAALPLPAHSEKLRNYMTGGMNKLPIGETDPVKRLKFCSKDYQRLKHSVSPVVGKILFILPGFIPIQIIRPFSNGSMVNVGMTNFPGGYQHGSIEGCKCVDMIAGGGIGPFGILFCALSYVDGIRISVLGKHSIMTKEEVTDLTNLLQKHVDILRDEIVKDI